MTRLIISALLLASLYVLVTRPLLWLEFVFIGLAVDVAVAVVVEAYGEWRAKRARRVEVAKMWMVN